MAARTYDFDCDAVFDEAIRALDEMGCRVSDARKAERLINFTTSMSLWSWKQKGSVLVSEEGSGRCVVSVTTKASFQLYDWGEGKRIANRLYETLAERLNSRGHHDPSPPV